MKIRSRKSAISAKTNGGMSAGGAGAGGKALEAAKTQNEAAWAGGGENISKRSGETWRRISSKENMKAKYRNGESCNKAINGEENERSRNN